MTSQVKKSMQNVDEQIRALKIFFAEKIPKKMAEIEAYIQQSELEPLNLVHWDRLLLAMHTLAGSSGSFGFEEMGTRARAIEKKIHSLIDTGIVNQGQECSLLQTEVRQFVQWGRAHGNQFAD